ncbi:MAG: diguanylate cyclase domain-containing protein [Ruminococcus sp.]
MKKQMNNIITAHKGKKIGITLLVMVILVACSCFMATQISDMATQVCWDALEHTAMHTARDIKNQVRCDQELLESISTIIEGADEVESEKVQKIIDEFQPNTMISHIALLLPEDKIMLPNEQIRGTNGILSYEEEAAQGKHISDRSVDIRDESKYILRSFVPVIKDGETVAMLYGVVDLEILPERLERSAYGGEVQISIVDALNGDYIVDTWHKTLGNINDMGERKPVSGESPQVLCQKSLKGESGYSVFLSKTIGENLYFYSYPADVNNWCVGIHVPESLVFDIARQVNVLLFGFISIEVFMLAGYFIWLLRSTKTELIEKQKLADTDLLTGLLNRNCYETSITECKFNCRKNLTCIYVDANGLHELNDTKGHEAGDKMLKEIAWTMKKHFGEKNTYRIGGDEFVAFAVDESQESVQEKISGIDKYLLKQDYHISVGLSSQDIPVDMESLIKSAEIHMYEEKSRYYQQTGKDRRRKRK